MKGTAITAVALGAVLAAGGCKKQTGPKTTEILATERPVERLMPEAPPPEPPAQATAAEPAPPAPPKPTQPPTPPTETYTVQAGDTLWSIAQRLYGDGKRWKDIAQANGITDARKLTVGTVLKIP